MTDLDLDAVEAMHPDEPGINPFVRPLLAELREARADADLLRDTLRVISEWDAINPPPADGSDLPWLRRVVDGAFPGGAPATSWQHIVADRDEARAAIARVRALHVDSYQPTVCDVCEHDYRMPCGTLRALDGAS